MLPTTKRQYAVDLSIGFFIATCAALVAGGVTSTFLSLPAAMINQILVLLTAVAFVADLIRFKPGMAVDDKVEINKFFYFTFGPYHRLFNGVKKTWHPWIRAGLVVLIACVAGLTVAFEKLDSQAFLKNSNTVVSEIAESLSALDGCQTLGKCPQEYDKTAKIVRSYAIPRGADGFVMIISKDNGVYRAIVTEGAQVFSSRRYALPPLSSANGDDKQAVVIHDFEPLFNQDFGQVVSTFRTGGNSVEIARINTYERNDSRLYRSLHRVDVGGRPVIIYIASNQGFLFTPRQEFFLQQDVRR